ncbi:SPFH domain-containing protein [Leptolyngbya sp. O-77]|uniref:SPFH domain-containing protein n=1 Tax=Leptolyngbya sp. O-77 TaxID=1080068 RepID=UPI00074D3C8F|nr:SPFH domain-containing protein [Leptolyngbya sp. O-77]BAU40874.1 SPFH domain / Band 7 family protein [Leptolyngbya sp. O-77]
MSLFEKIRGEFVDIIEWLDSTNDTMVYRFQRYNNEIKMGAKLTVRPGQKAVFVNEGRIADCFEPGMYTLSTQNLPILTTLMGWPYAFNSPFKAEVYFFNTRIFTNLKWGTSNPILIRDADLGPVRLRAYGTYNVRIVKPEVLLQELVSTDGLFQVDEVSDHIRNMIITAFTSAIGAAQIPLFDLASRYREISDTIRLNMQPEVQQFGLDLTQLLIENISLPPEVETALDRRASIGVLGNMQQYTQYQVANSIEQSAQNPSGGNSFLELGVGLAMAQQVTNALHPNAAPPQAAAPPQPTAQPQPAVPPAAAPPPPPPPLRPSGYLSRYGQTFGPFSVNQLLQQGLTAQTYVWRAGMSGWQFANAVPELAALLPPSPAA